MRSGLLLSLLLASWGCKRTEQGEIDPSASLSDAVVTVPVVTWESPEAGVSWVEYGLDESYGMTTPPSSADETVHRVPLFGIPPLSTVHWRAVTETEDGELSATGTIETGNVPANVPGMEPVELVETQSGLDPYVLASVQGIGSAFVVVVDRQGEVLWYFDLVAHFEGRQVIVGNLEFDLDSNEILVHCADWTFDPLVSGVLRIGLEGEVVAWYPIDKTHHGFTQFDNGDIGAIVSDERAWFDEEVGEEVMVYGDAVVRLSPDGTSRTLFSTWDWGPITKTAFWDQSPWGEGGDWTHANSIKHYAQDDTLLLSLGAINTVLELDGTTGEVLRTFGGEGGYTVTEGGNPFFFQHSPRWSPDGTLLVSHLTASSSVVASEYTVDDERESLTEIWTWGEDARYRSFAGGEAVRLESGNTLFGVGSAGLALEIAPDASLAWALQLDMGQSFLWFQPFVSFYEGR